MLPIAAEITPKGWATGWESVVVLVVLPEGLTEIEVPNAIKGSPLGSNRTPPIIVSIAIIVTPRGLVDFSFYNLFSIIRILFNCKYNMIRSRSYITNLIKLINSACMPCMFL